MKARSVRVGTLLLLASAAACSLDVGPQSREVFEAEMRSIIVPAITFNGQTSAALGVVTIEDGRVYYDLYIANVEGAKTATLHLGAQGEDTPAVSTLWTTSNAAGVTSQGLGLLVQQDRLDSGELSGATYQQVLDAIRSGNAYILMTTVAYPSGAFRAQILPAG